MLAVFVCEPFLFVYPHRYLYLCTVRRIGHTHIFAEYIYRMCEVGVGGKLTKLRINNYKL